MSTKTLFIIAMLAVSATQLAAQTFEEQTAISLTGVAYSSADWGDYDNDGDLDILITGRTSSNTPISKIYRNNGNNSFTDIGAGLTGVEQGCGVWGDYNNDGYQDVIISGYDGTTAVTKLYRNSGYGTFYEQTGIYFLQVYKSCVDWGDYDNDGYLDLVISGDDGSVKRTLIFRNDCNGGFVQSSGFSLAGLNISDVEWGDINGDGFLDLLLTGSNGTSSSTIVYTNDGNSGFDGTYIKSGMPDYAKSTLADYDSDGDLDILIISNSTATIYKNNGDGSFVTSSIYFSSVVCGDADWGDYDNDGDLDIIYCGTSNGSYTGATTKVYNNNNGSFSSQSFSVIEDVYQGDVAWGDYDNDGDLDILLVGYTGYEYVAKIIKNTSINVNHTPGSPTNLQYGQNYDQLTLSWDAGSDSETNTNGLNYDLYIKNNITQEIVFRAPASLATGVRRVAKRGNINGLSIVIPELPGYGEYKWAVQTIDNSFKGSDFSSEGTIAYAGCVISPAGPIDSYVGEVSLSCIEYPVAESREWKYSLTTGGPYSSFDDIQTELLFHPEFESEEYYYVICECTINGILYTSNEVKIRLRQFEQITVNTFQGISDGNVDWGDYNNDGLLDFVLVGLNGSTRVAKIYKNLGENSFENQTSIVLTGVSESDADWGDYNNDGFLDLIICGREASVYSTKVYKNNDGNSFTEQTDIVLPGVNRGSVAWGDYNNDGNLDILLSGTTNGSYSGAITKVFLNLSNNEFHEQGDISLPGVYYSTAAWCDLNNDNNLDIIISGDNTASVKTTKVYKNNGNNEFVEMTGTGLLNMLNSRIDFGDYDSDGDMDILMIGSASSLYTTCLYENLGNFQFSVNSNTSFTGVCYGDLSFVDYDNDGDLDIYTSGKESSTVNKTRIYKNIGNGSFEYQSTVAFPNISNCSASWGDYDNDGDLDLLMCGKYNSSENTYLYKNNINVPNTIPGTPDDFSAVVNDGHIDFTWSIPADEETPSISLKYNLSIVDSITNNGLYPTMAGLSDGKRKIAHYGFIGGAGITISRLQVGVLKCRIQAIDNNFEGSLFSEEITVPNYGCLISPLLEQHVYLDQLIGELTVDEYPAAISREWKYSLTSGGPYQSFPDPQNILQLVTYPPEEGLLFVVCQSDINGTIYTSNEVKIYVTGYEEHTDFSSASLSYSDYVFGDYDNDNDMDLFLTGAVSISDNEVITRLYNNNGNVFTEQAGISISGSDESKSAIGDYNNDGYLDIIIGSKIYKNNGDNTFTYQSDIVLPDVKYSDAAWGDYDKDGDLDLILTGYISNTNILTKIYKNKGDNQFAEQTDVNLKGAYYSYVDWGDYDNDGDLDILIAGKTVVGTDVSRVTIYRNDGNNSFDEIFLTPDPGESGFYEIQNALWTDYDSDGDLDLMFSSVDSYLSGYATKLYENIGNDTFQDINADLLNGSNKKSAWGDYDNDGDMDVLLSGKMFKNDGNNILEYNYTFGNSSLATSGDCDNDGDLDIISLSFYENVTLNHNTPPLAPEGLQTVANPDSVVFSWDVPYDNSTPTAGISYDIMVINTEENNVIFNVIADTVTGFRRMSVAGRTKNNFYTANIPVGSYRWSVQAVDNTYGGSDFAEWQTFEVKGCDIVPEEDHYGYVNTPDYEMEVREYPAASSRIWMYSETQGGPYIPFSGDNTGIFFSPEFNVDGLYYVICESTIDGIVYQSNEVVFSIDAFKVNENIIPIDLSVSKIPVEWGDYNNDNYLDVIMGTKLYQNVNGINLLYQEDVTMLNGAFFWIDHNNDGLLDFMGISRYSHKFYSNQNDNTFAFNEVTFESAIQIKGSYYDNADYDNDGDMDAIRGTMIYRNDGNNMFTQQNQYDFCNIDGISEWGDYNNDGYQDLIIAGIISVGTDYLYETKLYKNNGDNTFTEQTDISLKGLYRGDVDWGDYDSDGDLDILISGSTNNTEDSCFTLIYKNNGNNSFTELTTTNFQGIYLGSNRWGDYDNDGDLDILLSGNNISKIYRNEGNDTFSERTEIKLQGLYSCEVDWVDYDNDNDLDLSLSGRIETSPNDYVYFSAIYENYHSVENTVPTSPSNLISQTDGNSIVLSWTGSNDAQTSHNGLNYNLKIVYADNLSFALSPVSDTITGMRRINERGSIQDTSVTMNLPGGNYLWSVQAVDNNFQGSEFSANSFFTIAGCRIAPDSAQHLYVNMPGTDINVSEFPYGISREWKYSETPGGPYQSFDTPLTGTIFTPLFREDGIFYVICESTIEGVVYSSNEVMFYVNPFRENLLTGFTGVYKSSVEWGDYDNDGDLDILLLGNTSNSTGISKIYKNNGDGTFTEQTDIVLPVAVCAAASWGDYDNDGDLDILMSGTPNYESNRFTYVVKNEGSNIFTVQYDIELFGNYLGNVDWGDYDNDGDLDILIAGNYGSKVYKNDGNNIFILQASVNLPTSSYGDSEWGDYDNDGDLDILIDNKVFRNEGLNTFSEQTDILFNVSSNRNIAWGDYDNDGDLDLIIAGENPGNEPVTKIYRNDGNNVFVELSASIVGVTASSIEWGDYDNDGDLDILFTGKNYYYYGSNYARGMAKIYKNEGGDNFIEHETVVIEDVSFSNVAWGDYDNDNDLDFILTGQVKTQANTYVTKLYENMTYNTNTVPDTPVLIGTDIVNNTATFNWNSSTDAETASSGLNYNMKIINTDDENLACYVYSDTLTGVRYVSERGHIQDTTITMNLSVGSYKWSVQAIDNCFKGSEFSDYRSFSINGASIYPVQDQYTYINEGSDTLHCYEYPAVATSRTWKFSEQSGGPYQEFITDEHGLELVPKFYSDGKYFVVCESTIAGLTYTSNEVVIYVDAFKENTEISFPAVQYGDCVWGDYDNDGDLDLIIMGSLNGIYANGITKLYKNDGANSFTEVTGTTFPSLTYGKIEWVDFDLDGDLDLSLAGNETGTSTSVSLKLFRNEGNDVFVAQTGPLASYTTLTNVSWVDYDMDCDLDLLITLLVGTNHYATKLYQFVNNEFVYQFDIPALTDISVGDFNWDDYDNDGDVEMFVAGNAFSGSSSDKIIKLFNNEGSMEFSEVEINFPYMTGVKYDWGDYNDDGFLDLVIIGDTMVFTNGSYSYTGIYRNNGNNSFTELSVPNINDLSYYAVKWFDYNNDGKLDIIESGYDNSASTHRTLIFKNNGNDIFEVAAGITEFIPYIDNVSIGDYDNDMDLDIVSNGRTPESEIRTILYDNLILAPNTTPIPPTLLTQSFNINDNTTLLSWNRGTDNETSEYGLSYSVEIIDNQTQENVTPAFANASGKRLFVEKGRVRDTSVSLHLTPGEYKWRVQTVDHGFAGSAFSDENILTVSGCFITPETQQQCYLTEACTELTVEEFPNTALSREWKYSDNIDGPYQSFETPESGITCSPVFYEDGIKYVICESVIDGQLYHSNAVSFVVNRFEQINTDNITDALRGSVAWGDTDNDGDMDFVITGKTNQTSDLAKIGINNGLDIFDFSSGNILNSGLYFSSAEFGDYDMDGDLDLIVCGINSSARVTKVYKNAGNNSFEYQTSVSLSGVCIGTSSWVDYDNDGDLDICITGSTDSWTSNYGKQFKIYKNESGVFTEQTDIVLPKISYSDIDWGDYDNDGDMDIIVIGQNESITDFSAIFENKGNNIFEQRTDIIIPGVSLGGVAWADYNNDGNLDFALTGRKIEGASTYGITKIFKNTGSGNFSELTGLNLLGAYYSCLDWGDYDNDGDADLFISGTMYGYAPNAFSRIIENKGGDTFETHENINNLNGTYNCSADFGDYDNDGDLDIILVGASYSANSSNLIPFTTIYKNHSPITNTRPGIPDNLNVSISDTVTFSWDRPTDSETDYMGLSYNVLIQNTETNEYFTASTSDILTGNRLVPCRGIMQDNIYKIVLPEGNYKWAVQSIDAGYMASEFSEFQNFTVSPTLNTYNISFTVLYNSLPVEGAEVVFNAMNLMTNADGEVLFENAYEGNNYSYSASKAGFITFNSLLDLTENMTVTINLQNEIIINDVVSNDISCSGYTDGQISIDAVSGNGIIYYSIDNGENWQLNSVFNSLTEGSYYIEVKDENNAVVSYLNNPVIITEPDGITITGLNFSNITCNGLNDGNIELTTTGGTSSIQFSVIDGIWQDEPVFDNLSAGEYIVKVKDINNCELSYSGNPVVITEPENLLITGVTYNDILCNGESSGQITITANGGTGEIMYSIIDGVWQSESLFANLSGGNYTIKVSDENNCIDLYENNPVEIFEPEIISVSDLVASDVSGCYGNDNGSITISASGGSGVLQYSILENNWQTAFEFDNLSSGSYTVRVKDENGCLISYENNPVIISEPLPIEITGLSFADISCNNETDGQISIVATGATGTLQYSIFDGIWQDNGEFTDLTEGEYFAKVKDANNCEISYMENPVIITNPDAIEINNVTITDVNCYGGLTGQIEVNAIGGTGELQFSIIEDTWQNESLFAGLQAGEFMLNIEDENGCNLEYDNNPITILQPLAISVTNVTITDVSDCFGANNGEINVDAIGGTGTLQFSIIENVWQNESTFSNLYADNYELKIKDGNDCVLYYENNPISLSQPDEITITNIISNNVVCNGEANGSITFSANGGTGALEFRLNEDSWQADPVFNGLIPGNYNISVRDNNMCEIEYLNNPVIISEPEVLLISDVLTQNLSCYGDQSGKIEIVATGGNGDLAYSIIDGIWQEEYIFNNLQTNNYNVKVKDSNGCETEYQNNPVVLIQPDLIEITEIQHTDVLGCYGDATGEIVITATGGAGLLEYSITEGVWQAGSVFNSLSGGDYYIKVKDSNDCLIDYNFNPVVLTQPENIIISDVIITPNTSSSDGSVEILASGGTGELLYSIDNGSTFQASNVFTGLENGDYVIIVKDENNCQATSLENVWGLYDVTFNVTDNTTSEVLEDATIEFNNETLFTNNYGTATFESVTNGEYGYLVSKQNYETVTVLSTDVDKLIVADENVIVNINLVYSGIGIVESDKFRLFPNPTTGKVFIEGELQENMTVIVSDVLGKQIQIRNLTNNDNMLDLEDLVSGIYFVEIISGNDKINIFKVLKR